MLIKWLLVSCLLSFALATTAVAAGSILPADELLFASDRDGISWEIYTMDVHRHIAANLTRARGDDYHPRWSPDGKQIVFASERSPFYQQIFIMDANGRSLRQMTAEGGGHFSPSWSPDGTRIIYVLRYGQIKIMRVDDQFREHFLYGFAPSFSPDGRYILLHADSFNTLTAEIYAIAVDHSRYHNLSRNDTNDWNPAWSWDGRRVAFVSSRAGNSEIFVISADCIYANSTCDEEAVRVTFNHQEDDLPAWSPDGEHLVFVRHLRARDALISIELATGIETTLLGGDGGYSSPSWRPRP